MRLVSILQIKRVDDTFHLYGERIRAYRRASDGYGVLLTFEPSQLDKDFAFVLGPKRLCWFITAKQLLAIEKALDLSDQLTRDWLRNGKGWVSGPRPLANMI